MNPFFFGTSGRELYGAYDPARAIGTSSGGPRAVLLCQPIAREYLLAHPTMRLLARRLADAGWHAMRFDYYGTGDSAGEMSEATQEGWVADVGTAIEELKELAHASRVSLVGMRYGALLAGLAAGARNDVERLVLWDPVYDGVKYLRELKAPIAAAAVGWRDVNGVALSNAIRSEIESVTPVTVASGLPNTLVVNTLSDPATYEAFDVYLRAHASECTSLHVPDVNVWREEWGAGGTGMAVSAVESVIQWLS